MKSSSLSKITLLACALGVAGFTTAFADDPTPTPTPAPGTSCPAGGACQAGGGWHHHFESVLTADEKAELKADKDKVFAANPDLQTEGKELWESSKGLKDATPDEKKAQFEKWKAYTDKLNAAIIAVDPNAAPILAKLKAAFHHHHHDDGDTTSDTSNQ